MASLEIIKGKDQAVLRAKAKKVPAVTKKVLKLISNMKDTLKNPKVHGVGLAAPQINESVQIFIANVHGKLQAFINPIITYKSNETAIDEEGCLSLPGIWANIPRSIIVRIEYEDEQGKKQQREYTDFEARIIQHEYDHLQGILFIDYLE